MIPHISVDELDRDARITRLERQVLILSGQLAARDAAVVHLLKECFAQAADTASAVAEQYSQMLAEIDTKVLSAITEADREQEAAR